MARGNVMKLQVHQDIYDSKSMLDEQNWYHHKQGKPDELTAKLTYLMGNTTKNYPISTMTLGNIVDGSSFSKKTNMKELNDIQFTYPVMGRSNKACVVADSLYQAGDKPGIGNSIFEIPFTDNWIKRHYIIESSRGIQAYVTKDAEKKGDYWVYQVQLDPADADDFCPLSELTAGTRWTEMNTANAESESRGTEFKRVTPGRYKNQMGVIRLSHSWAGNSANRIMNITLGTEKGEVKAWMDLEVWQFEKAWLEECETNFWYSRYNRAANGSIALKDILTGKSIPRGSGLLEQIPNYHTYSKLTYNKIQNTVSDALFGQDDTDGMTITLHTGRGGMREFDRVMKEHGATVITDFGAVADKFILGSGRNLALSGFFDTMYHVDGYLIKVKHNPVFDRGRRAMASPLHPESGLPLESYRMVFIDDSDYEGEANLQYVTEKGRSFLHGVVAGLTPMPNSIKIAGGFNLGEGDVKLLSSEQDKSSYHRFAVGGIQLLRASKCMHLECISGL